MMVNKVGLIFAAIRAKVFHWKKVDQIGEGDMWEKLFALIEQRIKKILTITFYF